MAFVYFNVEPLLVQTLTSQAQNKCNCKLLTVSSVAKFVNEVKRQTFNLYKYVHIVYR